jgi:hypothetical protein
MGDRRCVAQAAVQDRRKFGYHSKTYQKFTPRQTESAAQLRVLTLFIHLFAMSTEESVGLTGADFAYNRIEVLP